MLFGVPRSACFSRVFVLFNTSKVTYLGFWPKWILLLENVFLRFRGRRQIRMLLLFWARDVSQFLGC